MKKRFYEILGYCQADAAAIKKVHRKALEYHPDKIRNKAQKKNWEAAEAYEI
jgi:DnaJ-class molecular chaperone